MLVNDSWSWLFKSSLPPRNNGCCHRRHRDERIRLGHRRRVRKQPAIYRRRAIDAIPNGVSAGKQFVIEQVEAAARNLVLRYLWLLNEFLQDFVNWEVRVRNEKVVWRTSRWIGRDWHVRGCQDVVQYAATRAHRDDRVVARMKSPDRLIDHTRGHEIGSRTNATDWQSSGKQSRVSVEHVPRSASAV